MAEYVRIIHCDATYSGPLSGGRVESRIAGYQEVVVAGGTGTPQKKGGGKGVWGKVKGQGRGIGR